MFGVLTVCVTSITINYMIQAYNYSLENYTITNIESLQYPLWNLTFPGVYICSLNRISLIKLNGVLNHW